MTDSERLDGAENPDAEDEPEVTEARLTEVMLKRGETIVSDWTNWPLEMSRLLAEHLYREMRLLESRR